MDYRRRELTKCAVLIALAGLHSAAGAQEQPPSDSMRILAERAGPQFPINDEDPESSVPTPEEAIRRPLHMGYFVMLVAERAEAATKRGDHAAAIKYYRALAKAAPDRATGFGRICREYESMGDRERALESCKTALSKEGVKVDDYARFFRLMLGRPGALDETEIADLDAIITHLETELAAPDPEAAADDKPHLNPKAIASDLRCQLGARLGDAARLQRCTNDLKQAAPNDPRVHAYSLALALAQRDLGKAERVVEEAERAGLPAKATEAMKRQVDASREELSMWRTLLRDTRSWIAVALLAGALMIWFVSSRKRDGLRPA